MTDISQPAVVAALQHDKWVVQPQVTLRIANHPLRVDIFAEHLRRPACIAVEIKTFQHQETEEVYLAIGQYLSY